MAYEGGYTGAVDTLSQMRSRGVLDDFHLQQIAGMAQAQAQVARQQAARQAAGNFLFQHLGGQQPQIPQPPSMSMAPAPQPGALSPGGGNPQVMPPAPRPGMAVAPMPQPGPASAPIGGAAAQPIPPFRALPSAPAAQAAPGEVPPPPAGPAQAPAANDGLSQPRPFDLKNIVLGLRKQGVPGDTVMDMLDALTPAMNMENRHELDMFKANNAALKAANETYVKILNAQLKERDIGRKETQGDRRLDLKEREVVVREDKEKRLRGALGRAVGGAGNLKSTELVYPKDEQGRPDQTKEPIGVRGITKTGKIVNVDAKGHVVPTLAGATAKEGKATSVNVRDTVRGNLVEGSALNATNRLNEIEKVHPGGTVSYLFGKSAGDSVTAGVAHGAIRGTQSKTQQDIDAKWASFIDEAIPVFTGGLRGSDAFRRFLIEQAPQPGTRPEVIKEKIRLFRENIRGTQRAFANKFKNDPQMWGTGVTPEQVSAAQQRGSPRGTSSGTLPVGIPAGSTKIGKTPDGKDVYKAPDGQNYVPD